ncbi:MAG: hypothetical protein LBL95_07750 [Deltaproteobacteria bacterium]|jgi:hypothetical protein|nr:hypothetical protein [Deltaproteobacteria bacterium]
MFLREKLAQIDSQHIDVISAIREYFDQMLAGYFHNRPDLVGISEEDLEDLFKIRLQETESAISLVILAAIESWFRLGFDDRTKNVKSQQLAGSSRKYLILDAKTRINIVLDSETF